MIKKILYSIIITVVSFFSISLTSCNNDPEIITNTVFQTDTIVITELDTLIVNVTDTINLTEIIVDTVSTFILIRHAETENGGSDPNISTIGIERTEALKKALQNVSLTAVYSTNFNRTTQTAQPVADDHSIILQNYNPFDLDPFIDDVLENHKNESVLVVGHSNTTPALLNLLIGKNVYSNLPETEYDNLFIVNVFEKGRSEVLHLKYGK